MSPRTRRRSGFTLVEILMAMTVLMIVAAVAAALIESLLRIEHAGREHATNERVLALAASTFRKDVRTFGSAAGSDKGTRLTMADRDSGHAVAYRIEGASLFRYEWEGLEITHHAQFVLPKKSSSHFELGKDRQSVAIVIGRRPHPSRIEATLAANRRFEGTKP